MIVVSQKNTTKYKAMGFVESLIAIILVGVASVILMRIAANTLLEGVQNERIDKMTQYAVEGSYMTEVIIQEMLAEGKNPVEELGLMGGGTNYLCFVPVVEDSSEFSFKKTGPGPDADYRKWSIPINNFGTYMADRENRANLGEHAGLVEETETRPRTDYFRIVCFTTINSMVGEKPPYLYTDIVVGHILSKGNITKRGNVKDYVHSTYITL